MNTIRLTMAEALVRWLAAQRTEDPKVPLCAGVFAIFGHGNVAGLGHALEQNREVPTYRAHNEQAMAHSATAFAKASSRRRFMACTTSVGPGATNLVTAAATAHVNRMPLLLLPGDVFASRIPDPVLQQLEVPSDPTSSVNDCLRPVSRYWDRITRPEQLVKALPAALRVLLDPAECGAVTLALPQDVQTEAYDYPAEMFETRVHVIRRARPDRRELAAAAEAFRAAKRPLIIAGGGVHYSEACRALLEWAERFSVPVAETQAGKGALAHDHTLNVGAIGVTGSSAANQLASEADVVLAVGTRLSDFTTASRTLFSDPALIQINLNVAAFDAAKHGALPLVSDAREGLEELAVALGDWRAPASHAERARSLGDAWRRVVDDATSPNPPRAGGQGDAPRSEVDQASSSHAGRVRGLGDAPRSEVDETVAPADGGLPTDAQVVGAVNRAAGANATVVCAAGGLPGELHKLWRASGPGAYHLEYGYSCMGYEIAGGLGVKMAQPEREVFVMVGDGSYLMMSSEVATSVMLKLPLVIVVLDNRGFGCIQRLQRATGGAPFNNRLDQTVGEPPPVDFVAHARSLGAFATRASSLAELEAALAGRKDRTHVVVIDTDPDASTSAGGAWWDVAVPEHSPRPEVKAARARYEEMRRAQRRRE